MAVDFVPRSSALKALWTAANYNPWVRGVTLGATAAYMGYEWLTKDESPFPEPLPPSSKPQKSDPVSQNPSVVDPVKDLVSRSNENAKIINDNFKNVNKSIESIITNISNENSQLSSALSNSPLLQNQVRTKDALDSIALSLEKQNAVMTSLVEIVTAYADAFLNVKIVDAQNNKVNTDYQKTMAANSDYGDSEFFYAFKPTDVFWQEADAATQLDYYNRMGTYLEPMLLPSRFHASGEIDLIDSMDGTGASKSDIRRAVENYRKSNLSSEVRSLIGVALVVNAQNDKAATAEANASLLDSANALKSMATALAPVSDLARSQEVTNEVARTYYNTASHAISANEVAEQLSTIAQSFAPVAQWAQKAKVREEILITPRTITDLDGNTLAEGVTPLEMTMAKDATVAREKTDINNQEFDDDDFLNPLDAFPTIPFIPQSGVYDPRYQEPTTNSFLDIIKSKFSNLFP